jgi:hypothetical protein
MSSRLPSWLSAIASGFALTSIGFGLARLDVEIFVRLLTWASENPLVTGALTTLAGIGVEIGFIAELCRLGLYFVLGFLLVPKLLSRHLGTCATRRGFRGLVVCGSLIVVINPLSILTTSKGVLLFTFVLTGTYAAYFGQDDNAFGEDGYFTNLPIYVAEPEAIDEPTISPDSALFETLARGVVLSLASGIVALVAISLGTLFVIVGFFFPLLEVATVVWTGYTSVADTENRDFERDIYEVTRACIRVPPKGIMAVAMFFMGLFFASWPAFFSFLFLANAYPSIGMPSVETIPHWFAFIVLGPIAGIYGLWYWSRQGQRVNLFFNVYEDLSVDPDLARPINTTQPLLLVSILTAVYLFSASASTVQRDTATSYSFHLIDAVAFIIAVVALIVLARAYWLTRQLDEPQPVRSENRMFPLAYIFQCLSSGILYIMLSQINKPQNQAIVLPDGWLLYTLALALPVLGFYFPELVRHVEPFLQSSVLATVSVAAGILYYTSVLCVVAGFTYISALVFFLGTLALVVVWYRST